MSFIDIKVEEINDNVSIHIIDIEDFSINFKNFIDEKLITIYLGARKINLDLAKKKLFYFLDSKSHNTKMGAIAEFFIHLYLSENQFKQECLMSNLEEGSIKKGFDGYYSKDNEEWIMESKSGDESTAGISHKKKLKEAYNGLKSLLSGGSTNNPWENAYNHVSHRNVNTRETIIKNIERLSDEFDEGVFYNIEDFNIIPTGTIFYDNNITSDKETIYDDIKELHNNFDFKDLKLICISKKSLNLFIDYLKESV
jgi:hypothetical protein